MFCVALVKTINIIVKKKDLLDMEQKRILGFSLYMQLFFLIYGLTGNTFYYFQQIYIYLFVLSIVIDMEKELKEVEGKDESRNTVN